MGTNSSKYLSRARTHGRICAVFRHRGWCEATSRVTFEPSRGDGRKVNNRKRKNGVAFVRPRSPACPWRVHTSGKPRFIIPRAGLKRGVLRVRFPRTYRRIRGRYTVKDDGSPSGSVETKLSATGSAVLSAAATSSRVNVNGCPEMRVPTPYSTCSSVDARP